MLPPGRFLSAVSFGVRFVGVCIPWSKAHVATGSKSKAQWEDHIAYLKGLKQVLGGYLRYPEPICILGDFNQAIPATSWNRKVFDILMNTMGDEFKVWTGGFSDQEGRQLIDHVATANTGPFSIDEIIEKVDQAGIRLSDHAGLVGTLSEVCHVRARM